MRMLPKACEYLRKEIEDLRGTSDKSLMAEEQEKIASLEEYAADNIVEDKVVFENVVGQDSLTRFDRPKGSNNRNKNKKRRNNRKRRQKNA